MFLTKITLYSNFVKASKLELAKENLIDTLTFLNWNEFVITAYNENGDDTTMYDNLIDCLNSLNTITPLELSHVCKNDNNYIKIDDKYININYNNDRKFIITNSDDILYVGNVCNISKEYIKYKVYDSYTEIKQVFMFREELSYFASKAFLGVNILKDDYELHYVTKYRTSMVEVIIHNNTYSYRHIPITDEFIDEFEYADVSINDLEAAKLRYKSDKTNNNIYSMLEVDFDKGTFLDSISTVISNGLQLRNYRIINIDDKVYQLVNLKTYEVVIHKTLFTISKQLGTTPDVLKAYYDL